MTGPSTTARRVAMYELAAANGVLVRHVEMCGACTWWPGATRPRPVCGDGMALEVRRSAAERRAGVQRAAAEQLAARMSSTADPSARAAGDKPTRRPPRWAPGEGQETLL